MPRTIDIDALYVRHSEGLLRFFARRVADAEVALDLWAETFAQAVRGQRRFRGSTASDEAGWLYAIARNQLADYLRRGYAQQRAVQRLGIERPPATDAVLREVERQADLGGLKAQLAEALSTLSAETREAVQLRVVDELPYPQVAERLSISEVAARARVSRGLGALSELLDPNLAHEGAVDMTDRQDPQPSDDRAGVDPADDRHEFDTHLAGYRKALGDAAPRVARRAQGVRLAVLTAATVAAAGVASIALVAAPDADHLSVVARAEAALAPKPGILHYSAQFTGGIVPRPGTVASAESTQRATARAREVHRCASSGPPELWVTVSTPHRWRMLIPSAPCARSLFAGRTITGDYESSYANGSLTTYSPADHWAIQQDNVALRRRVAPTLGDGGLGGRKGSGDPVEQIRGLLASGKLRAAGVVTEPGGRRVQRLLGAIPSRPGRAATKGHLGWAAQPGRALEYRVDASTFAPVTITQTFQERTFVVGSAKNPRPRQLRTFRYVIRFGVYEHLPLTPANEHLVDSQAPPGTTTVMTQHQIDLAQRPFRPRLHAPKKR